MSADFDAKLTALAAEIMRDAVRLYGARQNEALLMDFNPLFPAGNTGTFPSLNATVAFLAVTGSLLAGPGTKQARPAEEATGAIQVIARPFRAVTESFRALGQELATPAITLRRVFRLPDALPAIQLPGETELEALVRSAPTMTRLDQLARWLSQDERLVSATEQLTDGAAAEAAQLLGLSPEQLFLLWEHALTSHWFGLADSPDRQRTGAVVGETAWYWAEGDERGALHAWAVVFAAVAARTLDVLADADPAAARKLNFQGHGIALAVQLFLARRTGMSLEDVAAMVRDGAVGEYPSSGVKRAWQAWVRKHGHPADHLLRELANLHAVVLPSDAGHNVELTPLARWALREQFAFEGISVPLLPAVSAKMAAAHLVLLSAAVNEAEFDAAFHTWMQDRDPDQAVRELLIYAGAVGPAGRRTAVDIARRVAVPGYRAWQDALRTPELHGYALIALSGMAADLPESTPPMNLEPSPDDLAWLAVDLLAPACEADDPDPDVIAALFAEAVPAGEERAILSLMPRSSHPDAAHVLAVLGASLPARRAAREARKAARACAKINRSASRRRSSAGAVGL